MREEVVLLSKRCENDLNKYEIAVYEGRLIATAYLKRCMR